MKKFKLKKSVDFDLYNLPYASVRASTLSSFHRQVTYDITKAIRSAMDLNVYDFIDDDVSNRYEKSE